MILFSSCNLFKIEHSLDNNDELIISGFYSPVTQEIIYQWDNTILSDDLQFRINSEDWQDLDSDSNLILTPVSANGSYNFEVKYNKNGLELIKNININTFDEEKNELGDLMLVTVNNRPILDFSETNLEIEYKINSLFNIWQCASNKIIRPTQDLEIGENIVYVRTINELNEYKNYIVKVLIEDNRQIRIFADQDAVESLTNPVGYDYTAEHEINIEFRDDVFEDAEINLHGASSLGYNRKSYEIRLPSGDYTNLFSDVYADSFLLISMDADTGYLNHHMAFTILSELGLFVPSFKLFEVEFNYQSLGMYMLVEKTQDGIIRKKPEVEFVIRRRYYPEYDLKYYYDSAQIDLSNYIETYNSIYDLSNSYSGSELYDELSKRMDIDGYMCWIAFNTFVQNGDYSDEIFFYGLPGIIENDKPYFLISAWDYDDLFLPPHWGNFTPGSLVYCNEMILDKAIEEDSFLYNRYKSIFLNLLENILTEDYLNAVFQNTEYELSFFLKRKEICDIQHNISVEDEVSWIQFTNYYDDRLQYLIQRRTELITQLQ